MYGARTPHTPHSAQSFDSGLLLSLDGCICNIQQLSEMPVLLLLSLSLSSALSLSLSDACIFSHSFSIALLPWLCFFNALFFIHFLSFLPCFAFSARLFFVSFIFVYLCTFHGSSSLFDIVARLPSHYMTSVNNII